MAKTMGGRPVNTSVNNVNVVHDVVSYLGEGVVKVMARLYMF